MSLDPLLADRKCIPCTGGTPPLAGEELDKIAGQFPEWKVVDSHHIDRIFRFPDFVTALAFVNRVGAIAEQEGHHPDLLVAWGRVEVRIFTHKINGLTESDFILAAKIDREFGRRQD